MTPKPRIKAKELIQKYIDLRPVINYELAIELALLEAESLIKYLPSATSFQVYRSENEYTREYWVKVKKELIKMK